MRIRPFTVGIVAVGLLAGLLLAVLAGRWPSGSGPNVVMLNVGSGLFATAFISLALDLFWAKERARAEIEERQPLTEKIDAFPKQLEKLEERLGAFKMLGLDACHGSRTVALTRFLQYAHDVVAQPLRDGVRGGTIDLVTSSARGLMGYLDREPESVQNEWRDLMTTHAERFRVLLTHPAYAHLRQPAEERSSGDIELEILKTTVYLHCVAGMRAAQLRFYRGSPTVFTIRAGRHMLLNPYPYGKMAMHTLSLEFDADAKETFVSDFVAMHFNHTWAFMDQPGKRVDHKPLVVGVERFEDILEAFGECTYLGQPNRLRLTEHQVIELDVFTAQLARYGLKIPAPKSPFAQFVMSRGMRYTPDDAAADDTGDPAASRI